MSLAHICLFEKSNLKFVQARGPPLEEVLVKYCI
jgi:hypothetical protein